MSSPVTTRNVRSLAGWVSAGALACLTALSLPFLEVCAAEPEPEPAPKALTPVELQLQALEAQFNEAVARDLMKAHTDALAKLDASYIGALDQAMLASTKANKLEEALAMREEKKLIETHAEIPSDSDAEPTGALGRLRKTYLTNRARLEADFQRKRLPYVEKYEIVLVNYQKELTRTGNLDAATTVTAWITKVAAMNPASRNRGRVMAKVEIDTAVEKFPFTKGQKVYGDREQYTWDELPDDLKGFQYWRSKSTYQGTLQFKVKSDGLVYMACTHRFGGGGVGGEWQAQLTSREQLESTGWKQHAFGAVQALNEGHHWFIFYRDCKAGESFNIRTEKYASPFLIVKD